MAIEAPALSKRVSAIRDDMPKQRKRSRTGGSKDLYEGHSQDVMLAKTLIDPDHQCSVTTVKAYVTHVCAWFRFCRTLADPNYTLVNEEKLSGFLTWATQTPRLPCKTGQAGQGGSMSYQSARRYVEGGILALWRRYRKPDEENPLHALSYLNTKYAIREATAGERPRTQPERHYTALAIGHDQEDAVVRALLSPEHDATASIRAWAFYCLGAATWVPGPRRLHLRLDSLVMALRSDARLVEHTTVPFLEFRVSPDPAAPTARFAEVSIARHVTPLLCPWYAIALLLFAQWQARPSAMAQASLYDLGTWLTQPLFLPNTDDSLVFLPDDARVQMVMDEISPLLAQATAGLKATADSHIIRRRDKMMAEALGLSAPQVVRLEKWRVHHRRTGVTRQQTFFDLTLVLGGQNPPPAHTDVPHTFRAPARTRLQIPDHLLAQVFPWLGSEPSVRAQPKGTGFLSRQRSHSMSAGHSEDVARAERTASMRLMRELATVLLQDTAALLADPQYAVLVDSHPLFQTPLFASRAFRDFSAYAAQALSLQHVDAYAQALSLPGSPQTMQPTLQPAMSMPHPPTMQQSMSMHHMSNFAHSMVLGSPQPSLPATLMPSRSALSSDTLLTMHRPEQQQRPIAKPRFAPRSRRHTFETIGEEDSAALAQAAIPAHTQQPVHFNPMLLSQPLPFPPQFDMPSHQPSTAPAVAFPQLNEEPEPENEPMSQQYLMQIIDYLSVYNQPTHPPQNQLFPMSVPAPVQPLLSPMPHSADPSTASAVAAAMNMMCPVSQQQPMPFSAVATQFPRLASESSESTASPELASTSGRHMQSSQSMLMGPAMPHPDSMSMHGHPNTQLMYFASAQDYIDPASLVGTATPPSHMLLPKSKLHSSVSPSSSSPTPTPSSNSPGLPPTAQPAAPLPSNALHFAIAPQKLQFKADHELFM
ncbi:hypothetical protein IW139_002182 [Coemansia sp. RSA 353]|nr:hypothetical protein LPJ62_001769 [Coemansia sp. RSA 2167]KAJ1793792.1 hypothetical protein LPJ67_001180 [Coemansia sp. RSA 1938]KAJ2138597.1 hypothetical protein GGH17_001042 [Coemansia sp. RSA 788]KAJ2169923.1 hypothetical protein GGH15_000015 [Coemansia sp. RSA 562]KAJ2175503.1 hypothetical protein GGH16_000727 [Coemansia sp. RSA 560]KAJ2197242.1 hypothetical protein IW144_002525 [Coemansia sp. RSA 522]KAJ2206418.1 hypothetical protein IW145_002160 [Coemansia sp. RSA 521]KAJ2223801.1 h